MDFPNLATDNLYKFIALVGVFVLLAGSYFPIIKARELNLAMIEIEGQIEILEIEVQDLEDKTNRLKSNEIIGGNNEGEILDKVIKFKIKSKELRTNSKKIEIIKIEYELLKNIGIAGTILGSILSVFGFSLWYFRIQRYQDNQLKKNS